MKRALRITIASVALLTAPLLAFAVTFPTPAAQPSLPSGITNTQDFVRLLDAITLWLFYFLLVISVLVLIYAAFTYLTAGGEDDKISKAKSMILYAVIALVIAFLAKGVPVLVGTFLGQP
jgi:hypothetical protein